MKKVSTEEITAYIESHIPSFHERRLQKLSGLKLRSVLKRKNPYLFRAKNVTSAADLVKGILDAHLSSQEETVFGGFLEGLAVFVCDRAFGGRKSSAEGIDMEFARDAIYYIVSIKSGPNWGNASQIKKMIQNFRQAKRVLGTNAARKNVVAVNGCCYGIELSEEKGDYLKKCGQSFWSFISGDESFYKTIIEPLGHRARERNEEFQCEYGKVSNRFAKEFIDEFCDSEGAIDWEKLVNFNSGRLLEGVGTSPNANGS